MSLLELLQCNRYLLLINSRFQISKFWRKRNFIDPFFCNFFQNLIKFEIDFQIPNKISISNISKTKIIPRKRKGKEKSPIQSTRYQPQSNRYQTIRNKVSSDNFTHRIFSKKTGEKGNYQILPIEFNATKSNQRQRWEIKFALTTFALTR